MRIALAQISASADPSANLALVDRLSARAVALGAQTVVFPEATMCSFVRASAEVAEPLDGPWATAVRSIAARDGSTIVAGMFTTGDDERARNTLLVTGAAEASYDKIHLYDALGFRESATIAPGATLASVIIGDVTVGLATCYDIRFPAHFQALASAGADVILVPASWAPGPGKLRQWQTLATARAMDATAFVVAVDQAAQGDPEAKGPPTGVGHSMVVDPTGAILAELGLDPELVVVDLPLERVADVRAALPILPG